MHRLTFHCVAHFFLFLNKNQTKRYKKAEFFPPLSHCLIKAFEAKAYQKKASIERNPSAKNMQSNKDLFKYTYIFEYSFFDLIRDGITCYYMQLMERRKAISDLGEALESKIVNVI